MSPLFQLAQFFPQLLQRIQQTRNNLSEMLSHRYYQQLFALLTV